MLADETDRLLMSAAQVEHTVARMGYTLAELLESEGERVALIGVGGGGIPLVRRLARQLEGLLKHSIPVGILDVTMHRDDLPYLDAQTEVGLTDIPFDVTSLTLVLVDDVMASGRTIRAAMDAVMDLGRPRKVLLAVLVDRGLRELPIEPSVVGRKLATSSEQQVDVRLHNDEHGEDAVWLKRKPAKSNG